jgi:hypothetical protein
MLADAFDFVRNSDDWLPTVLIGGVLSILSVLIVPGFVLQGYLVRVLRDAAAGEAAAPSFTQWGVLLVDGVKLFAVGVVYSLVVIVPAAVLAGVVGVGGGAESDGARLFAGVAGLLVVLIVAALSFLLAYVVPAALTNFAVEGRIGAAFDVGTVRRAAFTSDYAIAWLLSIFVGIVGAVVSTLVSVTIVGVLLVPPVLFYTQVATYYLYGRGFAEGLGRERAADLPTA